VSHLLSGLATGVVVYAVTSGLALNPRAFLAHVDFITHGSGKGTHLYFANPATLTGYVNVLGEFVAHIVAALGMPTALAAAAGLTLAAFRDRSALLLVLPVLGLLVGVILPVRLVLFRYVLPAAWILTLFSASAVRALLPAGPLHLRVGPTLARGATVIVIAVSVGWSLLRGLDLTGQMLRDSRFEAGAWLERNAQPGDTVGYYGAAAKLPALAAGIVTLPGPHEDPDAEAEVHSWPEFILLIPQLEIERDHEWTLSEQRYTELTQGVWPYDLMLATQAPSLFSERLVPGVNPRVRVFVRRDVVPRLRDRVPIIEID
jgi:hypothetical protein